VPSRLRLVAALAVSALPLNGLRVRGYRMLGYRVSGSRIGLGTVIAVDAATINGARIGPLNVFLGPMSVTIEEGATVGNRNEFTCGGWTQDAENREAGYGRTLRLGRGATITCRHFFDVAGTFILGDRSWIAGLGSQFWTHGAGVRDRDVTIGTDCYIGSVVRFAPGASIGNNCLIAIGSVVTGRIDVNDALIGGVPAKVIKADYDWRSRGPASAAGISLSD
jgi:acetyltransferase-like isoleucine patch superfamily enzyme